MLRSRIEPGGRLELGTGNCLFGTSGIRGIVGPHVCLTESLEPDTMVLVEATHKIVRSKTQVDKRETAES